MLNAIFMVTEAVRDQISHNIPNFPGKENLQKLIHAKKQMQEERRQVTKDKEVQEIKRQGQAAWQYVDKNSLQLHIIAHSSKENPTNIPPYETVMHFMWDDVKWWGPGVGSRVIQEQRRRYQGDAYEEGQVAPDENDVQRRAPLSEADRELTEKIKRRLYWDPFVQPDNLRVSFRNSVATLSGIVEDRTAMHVVIDNVSKAGAKQIVNKLQVEEPYDPNAFGFGFDPSQRDSQTRDIQRQQD